MVKAAERWVSKQIARAAVATEDFKAGVEAPDRDPIKAALDASAKRAAKVRESLEKKTWEAAMRKVSVDEWKKATLEKGADRFARGIEFAEPKIRKFVAAFQPKLQEIQNAVRALPDVTDADREKRMLENLRRLKALKGKIV